MEKEMKKTTGHLTKQNKAAITRLTKKCTDFEMKSITKLFGMWGAVSHMELRPITLWNGAVIGFSVAIILSVLVSFFNIFSPIKINLSYVHIIIGLGLILIQSIFLGEKK